MDGATPQWTTLSAAGGPFPSRCGSRGADGPCEGTSSLQLLYTLELHWEAVGVDTRMM